MCPVTKPKGKPASQTDASTNPGNSGCRFCNPDRTDALVGDVSDPADNARIKYRRHHHGHQGGGGVLAQEAALKPLDIILKVNNIKFFGLKEFQATLTASDKGKALLVLVRRGKANFFVTLKKEKA